MAAVSATSSVPPYVYLFSPEIVSSFATILTGLPELKNHQKDWIECSWKIFAVPFSLLAITAREWQNPPKNARLTLLGNIIVLGFACATLVALGGVYEAYASAASLRAWKKGFECLAKGRIQDGMIIFNRMLKSKYRAPIKLPNLLDKQQIVTMNALFEERAYRNFAKLAERSFWLGIIEQNPHRLKNIFANILIWSVLNDIRTTPDEALSYADLKGRISIARFCSSAQRCGSSKPQNAIYELFATTEFLSDLRTQVESIPLPTKISGGHALLADALHWLGSTPPAEFISEYGNRHWLYRFLEKPKNWLIKDHSCTPGSTEEHIINTIQQISSGNLDDNQLSRFISPEQRQELRNKVAYDVNQLSRVISPEQRQELRNKIADYDRPFPA